VFGPICRSCHCRYASQESANIYLFFPYPEIPTLLLPVTSELTRPLVEILPLQMLTLVMANRKGLQAGQFRYVSKVTDRE